MRDRKQFFYALLYNVQVLRSTIVSCDANFDCDVILGSKDKVDLKSKKDWFDKSSMACWFSLQSWCEFGRGWTSSIPPLIFRQRPCIIKEA